VLYVGHFSFIAHNEELPPEHRDISGYFTCLVEAEDVDAAGSRLRTLIRDAHRKSVEFASIKAVFLDSLTEVHSLPKKGVIAHYVAHLCEIPPSFSVALPGTRPGYCEAYSVDEPDEDEEESEITPFVEFD
jgi:hypothetical protein